MKMLALISTQPSHPNEDITLKTPSLRERDNEREKEIRLLCVRVFVRVCVFASGAWMGLSFFHRSGQHLEHAHTLTHTHLLIRTHTHGVF